MFLWLSLSFFSSTFDKNTQNSDKSKIGVEVGLSYFTNGSENVIEISMELDTYLVQIQFEWKMSDELMQFTYIFYGSTKFVMIKLTSAIFNFQKNSTFETLVLTKINKYLSSF